MKTSTLIAAAALSISAIAAERIAGSSIEVRVLIIQVHLEISIQVPIHPKCVRQRFARVGGGARVNRECVIIQFQLAHSRREFQCSSAISTQAEWLQRAHTTEELTRQPEVRANEQTI